MEIIREIRKTIRKYNMLSENDHVLIGLSGGPDSVCLASMLALIKDEFNLTLSAVYIDHGLRPDETEKEKDFCKEFCDKQGIKFIAKTVDVKGHKTDTGMNLQESARHLRYQIFREVAGELRATCIALGHNADDQAETVLMRLLRGSGKKGLAGIPPVRGEIIRPLIQTQKKTIEAFLSDQPYMIDSSNLEDKYFRNWIRHSFMDELKKRNPALIEDICRTANILRDEDEYLEIVVTKTLMRMINRKTESTINLFLTPLQAVALPVLRRVLRRAVDAVKDLRGISFINIEDIINLIKNGNPGDSLNLPKEIRVLREYSLLIITTEKPVEISIYELQPSEEVEIKEAGIALRAAMEEQEGDHGDGKISILLDGGLMKFPLKIRAREDGDFFYPLGFGKKKKLQDFFVDQKIPREKRKSVPIIISGDDIIWIAGHRADDRYKVTEKTEKYIRLTMTIRRKL